MSRFLADTCLANTFDIERSRRDVVASLRFFQPWKSLRLWSIECMEVSKWGRGTLGFFPFRPGWNSHSPVMSVEWRRNPCLGMEDPGGTRVTFAPSFIHGRCGGSVVEGGIS